VTKYKPIRTPRQTEVEMGDRNNRAEQLKRTASSTIAHTRELLRESRELIERSKNRAAAMQATPRKNSSSNSNSKNSGSDSGNKNSGSTSNKKS
jgi:hypothetical protein